MPSRDPETGRFMPSSPSFGTEEQYSENEIPRVEPLGDPTIAGCDCPICTTITEDRIMQGRPPVEPETPDEEEIDEDDAVVCNYCRQTFHMDDQNQEILENYGDIACPACVESRFVTCGNCNILELSSYVCFVTVSNWGGAYWCESCAADSAFYCEGCDRYFERRSFTISYGEYDEALCEDCTNDFCNCEECMGEGDHPTLINSWDYKPEFKFFGTKGPTDVGPFFGLEVETSWPRGFVAAVELERWWNAEKLEDLGAIYVKTDSTVANGYEINTHPMTFEWAMNEFPWDSWDKLTEKYGAKDTDPSCGGHVHINKDSFTTSHLWKFIQFHHRLSDFCEIMGGRVSRDWGTLKGGTFEQTRKDAKKIAKDKYQAGQQRYQGLNFIPQQTVELRYPAGGSSVFLVKKNLQLAHSVWTFTKNVDAKLYQQGLMDDPGYFLWWLEENQDTYPELLQFVRRSIPHPKQFNKENI